MWAKRVAPMKAEADFGGPDRLVLFVFRNAMLAKVRRMEVNKQRRERQDSRLGSCWIEGQEQKVPKYPRRSFRGIKEY